MTNIMKVKNISIHYSCFNSNFKVKYVTKYKFLHIILSLILSSILVTTSFCYWFLCFTFSLYFHCELVPFASTKIYL